MTALEPETAIKQCEFALRQLMAYAYQQHYGDRWLERISSETEREKWARQNKQAAKKNAIEGIVSEHESLDFTYFRDLVKIAENHWPPIAAALDKEESDPDKSLTLALLKRLRNMRNDIGHSRPLVTHQRDLASGIAGEIRSKVTIYMSSTDPVGDIYPRIESISDSFGNRIDSAGPVNDEMAGFCITELVLSLGQVVTFTATGFDPQGRQLRWRISHGNPSVPEDFVSESGAPIDITWTVADDDVSESTIVQLHMWAEGARFKRWSWFDHRAYFHYKVRP